MASTLGQVRSLLASAILHTSRFNLLHIDLLNRLIRHRAFQYAVILPNLAVFWLVIGSGFFGSPVGNRNLSIVFVWMLWWFALIAIMVPFASRMWCTICPIPGFGEWLQRRGLIRRRDEMHARGLSKSWPTRLRNIWPQNFGFLTIATFSALLVTRPIVTGIVLSTLFIAATLLMLIYAKRAFCRYVCPVGGFLGLFSMCSSLELRVKDTSLCVHHMGKECIKGNENSFGCPWYEYPGSLERNNYCGLCFECVKACPFSNIALNLRPFGADLLARTGRSLDEAWKAFIMLTLAGLYIVVMQGPWGWIRDWANVFYAPPYGWSLSGLGGFALYAGIFWGASLGLTPAAFLLFSIGSKVAAGSKEVRLKKLFVAFSYELVPLALAAWIAFSIPIILVNWSYIANALSDPFGFGWNLLGTREWEWTPIYPELVPLLQVLTLAIGLVYSLRYGYRIARQQFPEQDKALRSFMPQVAFLLLVAVFFVWLFVG